MNEQATEAVAAHTQSVLELESAAISQRRYVYIQPVRMNLFYQDECLKDIVEATPLADGWEWSTAHAEYIALQKNWRQLCFVEYWNTYRKIDY